MVYSKTISTPPLTVETSPLITRLKVLRGLIYKVDFYFPPGSSGLLHCYVKDGNYQVYPTNYPDSFFGDNVTVSFEDLYEIVSEGRALDIVTWNEDSEFAHILQFRIGVVSKDEYKARWLPAAQEGIIDSLLSKVSAEQAATRQSQLKELMDSFTEKRKIP